MSWVLLSLLGLAFMLLIIALIGFVVYVFLGPKKNGCPTNMTVASMPRANNPASSISVGQIPDSMWAPATRNRSQDEPADTVAGLNDNRLVQTLYIDGRPVVTRDESLATTQAREGPSEPQAVSGPIRIRRARQTGRTAGDAGMDTVPFRNAIGLPDVPGMGLAGIGLGMPGMGLPAGSQGRAAAQTLWIDDGLSLDERRLAHVNRRRRQRRHDRTALDPTTFSDTANRLRMPPNTVTTGPIHFQPPDLSPPVAVDTLGEGQPVAPLERRLRPLVATGSLPPAVGILAGDRIETPMGTLPRTVDRPMPPQEHSIYGHTTSIGHPRPPTRPRPIQR